MLLIETTIDNFVKFVNLWNREYSFNMSFHGHYGDRTEWTIGNVSITGIEIAPNRVLCEFDNSDSQGSDIETREVTHRLRDLLSTSFDVDNRPNVSATYRIMERQAERVLRTIPPIFADTLDSKTEADFKASTKEKKPDIIENDEVKIPSSRLLLVTVTKDEAQAVLEVFSQASGVTWQRRSFNGKTFYDLGSIAGTQIFMVQSEMGSGGPSGAILTISKAIEAVSPSAVIMVGIAFGTNSMKQQLGDILISKQIQAYESQKVKGQQLISRGDRVTAPIGLLGKFRSGDNDWKGAKVHFGLILSGEKLVASQEYRDQLLSHEPEAIGGEMEGSGLYAAASDAKVDWILVKGICDWGTEEKADDYQRIAAENAARFVAHVIQQGGFQSMGTKQG